jgi:hypothetical protein
MDPTNKIVRRTTSLIKKSDIPEEVTKKLIPHASAPPRLCGLRKIHKKDIPLRPIVNCIASPTYALAKYLAGLLSPFVGQSNHHIKTSEMFVQNLHSISLQETDILMSFYVVSLVTKVLLEDTLQLLSQHLHKQTVSLIRHVLTTTYSLHEDSFYDQKDGVVMGSPLAPVVANLYMEHFERQALSLVIKKPTHWYRSVDDTFVVWPHGKDELQEFLKHLNKSIRT